MKGEEKTKQNKPPTPDKSFFFLILVPKAASRNGRTHTTNISFIFTEEISHISAARCNLALGIYLYFKMYFSKNHRYMSKYLHFFKCKHFHYSDGYIWQYSTRLSLREFLIVFLVSIYPGSHTKNSPVTLLHQADSQLPPGVDFPLL